MTGWEDEDAVEEVLAAKILVGHPITEDVARADEDRVSDGSDSAPVAQRRLTRTYGLCGMTSSVEGRTASVFAGESGTGWVSQG
jgi:hypothetical protein